MVDYLALFPPTSQAVPSYFMSSWFGLSSTPICYFDYYVFI